MAVDAATQRAVRELYAVGARYDRVPAPTPEVDPWEEDDPLDAGPAGAVVEFPGTPAVVVRLHPDGEDRVVVEDTVELDVPRRDTAAVVEAVLAGRVARRLVGDRWLPGFLAGVAHHLLPSELVVHVRSADRPDRTLRAPLVEAMGAHPWFLSLPVERDGGSRPPGRLA